MPLAIAGGFPDAFTYTALGAHDLPAGTFGHAMAAGIELDAQLVADDRIEAVAFSGSTAGGLALAAAAATRSRPIPVFAEMGSVNPLVVTRGAAEARGDAIAEGLIASVATFGGQLCTKPGVILLEDGEAGIRLAEVAGRGLAQRDPETLLTRPIAATYARDVSRLEQLDGVERLTPESEELGHKGFSGHVSRPGYCG